MKFEIIALLMFFLITVSGCESNITAGEISEYKPEMSENIMDTSNISLLYNELINSEDFSETNIQITAMDNNGENIIKCGKMLNSFKPASSFRCIPLIIALNCGATDLDFQINCTGSIENNLLRCYKSDGHGSLNIVDAVNKSCVTGYNELSKSLTKDVFMEHYNAQSYGDISKFDNINMLDIIRGNFSISPEEFLNAYRLVLNNENYNYIDEVIKDYIIYNENNIKVYKISGISDEPIVQSKLYIIDYNNTKSFVLASLDGVDSANKIDEYIISEINKAFVS